MKTKICLPILGGEGWLGGVSYIENLIKAIRTLSIEEQPDVYLYVNDSTIFTIELYAHFLHLFNGIIYNGTHTSAFSEALGRPVIPISTIDELYEIIDFFFCCPDDKLDSYCTAAWITDFQHIHLPCFFTSDEINERNKDFRHRAENALMMVLSSHDVERDFHTQFPDSKAITRILSFHTFPQEEWLSGDPVAVQHKYNLPDIFLICCNQFWSHKNHLLLFDALAIIRKTGVIIQLVCTGSTTDYRFPEYFNEVLQHLKRIGIDSQVHILGNIPRDDQIQLVRRSLAVVQPSLFEGWSTVVEDAKALGKYLILSDLEVHKEQAPDFSVYFDRNNADILAETISKLLPILKPGPDLLREQFAQMTAKKRVQEYGRAFCKIAIETIEASRLRTHNRAHKNLKAMLDDGQEREYLEMVTEYPLANSETVSLSQPVLEEATYNVNCLLATIPKAFTGHNGIIQENALRSWLQLLPSSSIILFGDDPTVAEIAARYGVKHISNIKCNRNGTPYLSDLFEQSCRQLENEQFFGYVNADCILDGNFLKALQALSLNGYIKNKFIASAQRFNIPVTELIDFSSANISETLNGFYANGVLDAKNAMDIFICHPEVLKAFPHFLVGRPGWDQWLVWHAHESGADVIDASEAFTVYHQSHDYTHVPGGWREACLGEEAIYNRRLAAGKIMDLFTARTHQLLEDGTVTTDLDGENSQHTDERAFYYAQQAIACMESEEYLGALDYIDMLLVAGKDAVPFAQQLRAVCFYKLGRMLEAKSAIINELLVNPANKEAQAIFSMISKEISAGS